MEHLDTCDSVPTSSEPSDKYYPSFFDLSFLTLPPESHEENDPIRQNSQKCAPSSSNKTSDSHYITPIDTPQQNPAGSLNLTDLSPLPSTKNTSKKTSSWDYVRPLFIDQTEQFTQHFKTLSPYIIKNKELLKIPCSLLVFDHDEEDIPFFHRLTKLISKQLFPARLEILASTSNTNFNLQPLLSLTPLSFAKKLSPQACFHQITVYQHISLLPIYPSFQYENDPQLRQHLWSILKQQPFAYTLKS